MNSRKLTVILFLIHILEPMNTAKLKEYADWKLIFRRRSKPWPRRCLLVVGTSHHSALEKMIWGSAGKDGFRGQILERRKSGNFPNVWPNSKFHDLDRDRDLPCGQRHSEVVLWQGAMHKNRAWIKRYICGSFELERFVALADDSSNASTTGLEQKLAFQRLFRSALLF